jgi:hypothetical protein
LSLPHLPQFFFSLQNRTCSETPLQIEVHEIIFPMSYHTQETGSEQESCAYFTLAMQSVQSWFQTAQRSMFLPYLLVWVFKIDDSWCVGKEIWRSFWILTFSSIVHLWTRAQILMEIATSLSSLVDD